MASFTAAGTAYSTHGLALVPFYIFYSMFGFQRIGDLVWAFGDQRGRGFLLGATAGRTTLQGEGLQHNDGHSPLLFSVVPNVRVYDPAYAYELAVIIRDGLRRMIGEDEDTFYYLTLYNENLPMPAMPRGRRGGDRARAVPGARRGRWPCPARAAPGLRDHAAGGAARRRAAREPLRGRRRRVVGHLLPATARRRPGLASAGTASIRSSCRGCPMSRSGWAGRPVL